jgi:hypothetical protein
MSSILEILSLACLALAEPSSRCLRLWKHTSHRRVLVHKSFEAAAQRACTYLVEACGTKDLDGYSRSDALKYRDYLIAKGLVGFSVSRVMSSIRAVCNFAISEYALDLKNPYYL